MSTEQILKSAIETFGKNSQLDMAVEEMSELTKEICKHKRGFSNSKEIAEEIADVYIMLEQLQMIFGNQSEVNKQIDFKVRRLEKLCKLERIAL